MGGGSRNGLHATEATQLRSNPPFNEVVANTDSSPTQSIVQRDTVIGGHKYLHTSSSKLSTCPVY